MVKFYLIKIIELIFVSSELKYQTDWFPMKVSNIGKFERSNPGLNINVLVYDADATIEPDEDIVKNPHVNIIRRSKREGPQIYVLLLEDGDKYHYVAVTNLDRLLNTRNREEGVRIQAHWCHTCLHGFRWERAYEKHVALCAKNVDNTTLYTIPEDKNLQFKN